ncbi:MAG: acyl carrier protein [Lentisphaeria bacterium]|nr:acyl carrier protein [Lentisphaeria bacterium]
MTLDTENITQALCREIATVTRKEEKEIRADGSLHDNGIDSMSFLELLLFIKREWGVDFLEEGIPPEAQKDIHSLAEHIQWKSEKK